MRNQTKHLSVLSIILVCSLFCLVVSCSDDDGDEAIPAPDNSAEDLLLNQTFRVDIKTIDVVLDMDFDNDLIYGDATVVFTMREGQTRPVIHFDPAIYSLELVTQLILDGEPLDISDPDDVQILTYEETTQDALEFLRDLSGTEEHILEMKYIFPWNYPYPMFFSNCNDIYGHGNEVVFPTLNSPQELAQHTILFRVNSTTPYNFIGSGYVQDLSVGNLQQWLLNTEQEISSYTLMFVLAPASVTVINEQNISGVDVRIMSFIGDADYQWAFNTLESWIPELIDTFGPFPMSRGLDILLLTDGGGMEYYGGTMTSEYALEHEVFHMYFACSTVAKTYRDSWWDEAINMWYEYSQLPSFQAIPDDYRSNIVSGRSPIAVGFDTRAYYEGAQIIQAVCDAVGNRDQMNSFLRYVHKNYSFAPFNTYDFLYYLEVYTGVDMYDQFQNWLYSDENAARENPEAREKQVRDCKFEMNIPLHVRKAF